MTLPPPRSMISPRLIGRDVALAVLHEQFRQARDARGTTVVIAGEAGIGKSRLVAELRDQAATTGTPVLTGRCFEPDRVLPYAPWIDLLHSLGSRSSSPSARADASAEARAGAFSPEADFLPPVVVPGGAPDSPREHRELVHAWTRLIGGLLAARPTILVIEDIHWADDDSLDVLLTLARRLAGQPVLLVITCRDDELSPGSRRLMAGLEHDRLAVELRLDRLSLPDVDAMLRAMFNQAWPIRADFLQAVFEITDGNPFFIEEVVRGLVAAGDIFQTGGRWERRAFTRLQIPRGVAEAVRRRTVQLSPEGDRLVKLAAVTGRSFDFAVLAALTGQNETALLALARELIDAQLIVEESADRFAFRHALTRQAIYAGMLTRERRALHRTIAETIARLPTAPDAALADLAYHYWEGEAWPEALDHGERAGARALAMFAPHAALEHFSRALDAANRLGVAPPASLLRANGRALATVGDFDAAREDFEEALIRARQEGDRAAEWRLLLDLGELWAGQDYARTGDYLTDALALARSLADPLALAESLAHLGGWHLNTERPAEAEHVLGDALAIFETANDRAGVARTLDLLGTVSDIAGDVALMRNRYTRAAVLFREVGDRQALSSTLATMLLPPASAIFDTLALPAHLPNTEMLAMAHESLALARDVGWRAGEAYLLLNLAIHHTTYGDFGAALAAARDGLAIAREIDHREWMTHGEWTHGELFTAMLAPRRAHEHFRRAFALGRVSGSRHWLNVTASSLAGNWLALGDEAAAAMLVENDDGLGMETIGQRRVWTVRAELASSRGDPDAALAIVRRLLDATPARSGRHDVPRLALLEAELLRAFGRPEEARERIDAVRTAAVERGLIPLLLQSQLALARLGAAQGDDVTARRGFLVAREQGDTLAATLPAGAEREEFLAGVRDMLPPDPAPVVDDAWRPLTRRERDVVLLIGEGRSNQEIAAALSIGERTVETHVSHVLTKLDLKSRTEVAAWRYARR